ncbi:MAG: serine/threonine-protein phosphatase, partial [Alloprevotella sp.]|nr:serine/threonine-protein phosphatase [Alloprevotella sp.]
LPLAPFSLLLFLPLAPCSLLLFLLLSAGVTCAQTPELDAVRRLVAERERGGDPESVAVALAGRDALFYNYGLSDSVLHYVPLDLERLKASGMWKQYYEVWMYRINTNIYYNSRKTLALRDVQSMYGDAKERGSTYGMGIAYYTMGNVYVCMGSRDEAAEAYRKGLDILSGIRPLPPVIPELYSNYGDVLNEQGMYRELEGLTVKWRQFLETFIPENRLTESEKDISWFYYDIACVQASLGLGDLRRAEALLRDAGGHIPRNMDFLETSWLSHMASLRLRQGRYQEAYELNTRRMALVGDDEDRYAYLGDIVQRAEILEKLGYYRETSALYRELYHVIDSINRADTKNQLAEMNTLFEVDDLKMRQEREQYRLTMLIVGVIVVALTGFTVFRYRASQRLAKAHGRLQKAHEELQTAFEWLQDAVTAREQVESDLRIARDIQTGMLPQTFPERGDLDLYASMTPAKEVGGDLYCYLLLDELLYFCVGDVSGKGVPAALFMAQAIRQFRSNAKQWLDPATIATYMNNELTEANDQGMFVTMFLGVVNLQSGRLKYCNAGHNPPVLVRDGVPEFMELESNAPIGLWPGLEYVGEEMVDIRGFPLFIYTDGLNEAENRRQEQFTDERLLKTIAESPFTSSRELTERLRRAVEQHRDGAEPSDDLTMMCLKIIGERDTNVIE